MLAIADQVHREVHKAIHKETRQIVALKRILMHNEKEGMPVTALREIKILKALKHPCIVDIVDMFVVKSGLGIMSLAAFSDALQVAARIHHYRCIWCSRTWTTTLQVCSRMNGSNCRQVRSSFT